MQGFLKDSIEDILTSLKREDLYGVSQRVLDEVLSGEEKELVELDGFYKDTLCLKVKSPLLLFILNFKKHVILKRLSQHTDKVKNIKFILGRR